MHIFLSKPYALGGEFKTHGPNISNYTQFPRYSPPFHLGAGKSYENEGINKIHNSSFTAH